MITAELMAHLIDDTTEPDEIERALLSLDETALTATSIEIAVREMTNLLNEEAREVVARIRRCSDQVMDCSGTGGSGRTRYNTSTTVAFVLAAGGLTVAKFGNRAVSSTSGSFDFLEALGYPANIALQEIPDLVAASRLAFLFAPAFYPRLQRLATIRRRVKRRTIFNYIGPLLNPVKPCFRLTGVSAAEAVGPVSEVLCKDPSVERALVVRSNTGLDEIDCQGTSQVNVITGSHLSAFTFDADAAQMAGLSDVLANVVQTDYSPLENVHKFFSIISGQAFNTPEYQLVVLNAGAAFHAAGTSPSIGEGAMLAHLLLRSGRVRTHVDFCRRMYERISR